MFDFLFKRRTRPTGQEKPTSSAPAAPPEPPTSSLKRPPAEKHVRKGYEDRWDLLQDLLDDINAQLGTSYNVETVPFKPEDSWSAYLKSTLRLYWEHAPGVSYTAFRRREQANLSALMKALNGEGEMTPELRAWWDARY